jgi:hypothetical protein
MPFSDSSKGIVKCLSRPRIFLIPLFQSSFLVSLSSLLTSPVNQTIVRKRNRIVYPMESVLFRPCDVFYCFPFTNGSFPPSLRVSIFPKSHLCHLPLTNSLLDLTDQFSGPEIATSRERSSEPVWCMSFRFVSPSHIFSLSFRHLPSLRFVFPVVVQVNLSDSARSV